jgi:hypothetical protein
MADFHHEFRSGGQNRRAMLPEPVRYGSGGSNRSTNKNAFGTSDKSANDHSSAGPDTHFAKVATIMARAFELPFQVDVASVTQTRIHQGRMERISLAIGQDHGLRRNSDRGFSGDTARFGDLSHLTFHGGPYRDHGFAIHHDRLGDPGGERISCFGRETG